MSPLFTRHHQRGRKDEEMTWDRLTFEGSGTGSSDVELLQN